MLLEEERLEGREEGREEGIQERTLSVAKNALQAGAEIAFVKKITGLSTKTLQQLQAELR
jgi:predicted transposase/invertase (TIGR01784 family)